MTKICHVISGYYRTDARVFQRQCKSLHQAGFEVCLLTNDGEPSETIDDIKIIRCSSYWKSRFKVLLFTKRQFLKNAIDINADIYQMHSPELLSLGIALQKTGKKVVYDAHEDLPRHILEKDWIPKIFRRPLYLIIEKYMNSVLAKYDAIVSPHSHVVEYLKKINNEVLLVANFPIINKIDEVSKDDYMQRKKIMCYSGTVYNYSNQEAVLNAMKEIPVISYEIAGFIDPNHLKTLETYDVFNRVTFLGRLPWDEMQVFYKKTIMGLVIYDYKLNLGYKLGSYGTNKIFEYMEAGLPIICTDYILWKEIVDNYHCGICVEPGNIKQIQEAINFLLNNPDKAFTMGQNGRNAVLQKYNWSTQQDVYVNLFETMRNSL
jgi:glycosyltransferase involved in cell wall biosynthesis